jgi:hypothetical protein
VTAFEGKQQFWFVVFYTNIENALGFLITSLQSFPQKTVEIPQISHSKMTSTLSATLFFSTRFHKSMQNEKKNHFHLNRIFIPRQNKAVSLLSYLSICLL